MPKSRRGSGGVNDKGKLFAAAIIAMVSFCAIAIGIYWWVSTPVVAARDSNTMCTAADPPNILVVLLDTSDGLPEPAKEEVFTYLKDIVDASPVDALVDVRSLDPSFRSGRPVLMLCNPGKGEGLSEFTGNPELAKRRWREKFREPILNALAGGLKRASSSSSPILQTLQGIAIDRFTGERATRAQKELVLVSDMLEYTTAYSQYPPNDLSYRAFKTRPFYKEVRTNLHGAEVTIFYIQRNIRGLNTGQHIQFWQDWIHDNNGQPKKATKLQGAGKT